MSVLCFPPDTNIRMSDVKPASPQKFYSPPFYLAGWANQRNLGKTSHIFFVGVWGGGTRVLIILQSVVEAHMLHAVQNIDHIFCMLLQMLEEVYLIYRQEEVSDDSLSLP